MNGEVMSGVRFTEDQSTNLATLYGRALDARAEHPVLGDHTAEDAVRRIDYDFGKFKISKGDAFGIACRGKVFDRAVSDFIAAHDECSVVHLGAGMDSRVFRLDPPPTVRWFDVGFAELAERTSDTVRTSSTCGSRSIRSVPTRPCSVPR
jgi:O-methyltransferase involved in polyketide biosynthesis